MCGVATIPFVIWYSKAVAEWVRTLAWTGDRTVQAAYFSKLFRAATIFNTLIGGFGYGLSLGFWVVFVITVSFNLTVTLITTLTVILP